MEGHTLITAADDVCASTQITFCLIAAMANVKQLHYRRRQAASSHAIDAVDFVNNVLANNGNGLMSSRKHPDIAFSCMQYPSCEFVPPHPPLQAWRAQVAPGLGSCPPQGCQGAEPPSMDIPRSLLELRQAMKTTTNTVSDEPLHTNENSVGLQHMLV